MKLILAALTLGFVSLASSAIAAEGPYNESADARAEIRQAVAESARAKVPVVVVFGANWCADCKVLDMAMKSGSSAPLFAKDFKVVKVDVGKFDKNVDIAEQYGVPLKKGIPAVAFLSSKGEVIYATRGGELADARGMGEIGIYQFFKDVTAKAKPRL